MGCSDGRLECRFVVSTQARRVEKNGKMLASDARSDLAKRKHPGTGGGPKPRESPYTDLIADIFGAVSALIDGVQGGMDVGDDGIFAHDTETEV